MNVMTKAIAMAMPTLLTETVAATLAATVVVAK